MKLCPQKYPQQSWIKSWELSGLVAMWELMMKYSHDEADVTMVSHMLAATNALKKINRSKADDTTIFIFLVYWVYKKQIKPLVLLEKWNRTILNINETCKQLDATCLQILGMHVLSGIMENVRCQPSLSLLVQRRSHILITSLTYTLFMVSLMPSPVILWNINKDLYCSVEFLY